MELYESLFIIRASVSDQETAALIEKMKAENAHVILVQPYQNRKTAETVARQTDGVVVDVSQHPTLGKILTDSEGRTLYHFTRDTPNVSSACYGQCTATWPPLLLDSGNPVAGAGLALRGRKTLGPRRR